MKKINDNTICEGDSDKQEFENIDYQFKSLLVQKELKKYELKLNFLKFLIGSVVVFLITFFLNHQLKERTLELKSRDQRQAYLKDFIDQALDDNLEKRVRFAHYFSSLLSESEWQHYYNELKEQLREQEKELKEKEKEYNQLRASKTAEDLSIVARLQEEIRELKENIKPKQETSISRVFIHIANEKQRDKAYTVLEFLRKTGFSVPGIQNVDGGFYYIPEQTEVRYFFESDRSDALKLLEILKNRFRITRSKIVYISGSNKTSIPRDIEIWLDKDAFNIFKKNEN